MSVSLRFGAALCLVCLLSGCLTTENLLTKASNLVAGVFNNFSLGAYKATEQQIRVAYQRASGFYNRLSPQERQTFKESGTRYLAVRTSDPTPAQQTEIRKNMQKSKSRYASPTKAPGKIYCVMIWDTQSQEIVGTNCYAVLNLPAPDTVAHFDTYTAQYVGSF